MKIRKEQADVFRERAVADFETRAITHLREHIADLTRPFTDADLRNRIRTCTKRAAAYGFTTQKQIICFVDATYRLGDNFDTDPAHQEIVSVMKDQQNIETTERAVLMVGMAYDRSHRDRLGAEPMMTGDSSDESPKMLPLPLAISRSLNSFADSSPDQITTPCPTKSQPIGETGQSKRS